MTLNNTVIANIIADSQEAANDRDTLSRRQFLTRLATYVGGIGGALSTLPAFAQLSSGQLQPDIAEAVPLTPVVEAIGEKVWENDQLNEDACERTDGSGDDEADRSLLRQRGVARYCATRRYCRHKNQPACRTRTQHTSHYRR